MKSPFIILTLFAAAVFLTNPALAMDNKEFFKLAVENTYKSIPPDIDEFKLINPERNSAKNPILYSDDNKKIKEIKCINTAVFGVKALANRMGSLTLSACPYNLLNDKVMSDMEKAFNKESKVFTSFKAQSQEALENAGIVFTKSSLNNGSKLYYFPLIAIGHGVIMIKTFVLHSSDREYAFVAQHYPEELCRSIENHKLCDNDHVAIVEILTSIMESYK